MPFSSVQKFQSTYPFRFSSPVRCDPASIVCHRTHNDWRICRNGNATWTCRTTTRHSIENTGRQEIRMQGLNAAYLTSRDELQRAQRSLQILGVALEVVKSVGERGLQLRRALSRSRVGSNLVERSHDCANEMCLHFSSSSSAWIVVEETVVVVRSVGGERFST